MNNFGKAPDETLSHIKYVDAVWSSGSKGVAGVILLYDMITNEYKAYWGAVDGLDEWEDICYLAKYGHKAPVDRHGMWFDMESKSDNPFENKD